MQPPPYPTYPGYPPPPPPPPAQTFPPPGAYRSPDGRYWWDGTQWRPVVADVPYQSAATRALAATILIGAVAAVTVLGLIFDLIDISALTPLAGSAKVPSEVDDGIGLRALGFFVLYYLAFIPAVVLLCVWIHRATRNLQALRASGQRFRPGWAVGWWFIPFANLVVPLLVVNEVWRGSDPSVGATDPVTRSRLPLHPILGFWWAAWIGGNLISNLAGRLSFQSSTAGGDLMVTYIGLAGSAVSLVAAFLVILIIKAITERQELKHARLQSGELV